MNKVFHCVGFMRSRAFRSASLVLVLATCLALFEIQPSGAVSELVDSYHSISAEEAAHWMELLGMKPESGVQFKTVTLGWAGTPIRRTL